MDTKTPTTSPSFSHQSPSNVYTTLDLLTDLLQWRNFVSVPNVVYLGVGAVIYTCPTYSAFPPDACPPLSSLSSHTNHGVTTSLALGIVCRNALLVFVVYSIWHHAMYTHTPALSTHKYNPRYPPAWEHDAARRWTMVGSLMGSLYELAAIQWWAGGDRCNDDARDVSSLSLLVMSWLLACLVSDVHFWLVHRAMHPWGWSVPGVGDVGKILYQHVHYLHHLRHNPGP